MDSYDNLTGVFGLEGVSGVGISFGADRIYDVLNALDLYPDEARCGTRVMFVNLGCAEAAASLTMLKRLRAAGIPAEIYPDCAKMKKQMSFANDASIPYVAIVGETELAAGKLNIKEMATGDQQMLTVEEAIQYLNK